MVFPFTPFPVSLADLLLLLRIEIEGFYIPASAVTGSALFIASSC
jgi:hypothetical protein